MSQAAGAASPKPETAAPSAPAYEATAVVRHLAHELRQPLSTIESIAYYLKIVVPQKDARTHQHLEKLQEVVQQAGWILSDAVHFLQASAPVPQLVDLNELICACVRDISKGGQNWVRLEMDAAPLVVRLDPEQARHLLRNVLFFFWEACHPEPNLSVTTSAVDGEARAAFEAAALDYTIEDLSAMFDPFSPHSPAGSGLSLASVRRIIEAHGGRLEFHSTEGGVLALVLAFPAPEQ